MKQETRFLLIRLHAALAAFFLPMGLLFLITGALYTLEIKGSYRDSIINLPLAEPLRPEISMLARLAEDALRDERIGLPTGGARIKRAGPFFELEWTGSNRDVLLQPTDDPLTARLVIKDTTTYRRFVQLHKAKGGWGFRIFAVIWAGGLLLLFMTGFILSWSQAPVRRITLGAGAAGVITFALFAMSG